MIKENNAANQDALHRIETIRSEVEKVNVELQDAGDSVAYFTRSWNTKKIVSNITSLTSGITNLVSSIQTLQNIGDIWNNDDLTSGEKFT